MNLSEVQAYYKARRETYPEPFRLRIHRALSWLDKAQQVQDDLDIRFQTLWIALYFILYCLHFILYCLNTILSCL